MSHNPGLKGRFAPKKAAKWPELLASALVMSGIAFGIAYIFAGALR